MLLFRCIGDKVLQAKNGLIRNMLPNQPVECKVRVLT